MYGNGLRCALVGCVCFVALASSAFSPDRGQWYMLQWLHIAHVESNGGRNEHITAAGAPWPTFPLIKHSNRIAISLQMQSTLEALRVKLELFLGEGTGTQQPLAVMENNNPEPTPVTCISPAADIRKKLKWMTPSQGHHTPMSASS